MCLVSDNILSNTGFIDIFICFILGVKKGKKDRTKLNENIRGKQLEHLRVSAGFQFCI